MASSSNYFTVATTLISTPLSTVYFSHSEQRRSSADALAQNRAFEVKKTFELYIFCDETARVRGAFGTHAGKWLSLDCRPPTSAGRVQRWVARG